jgi:tetratricopeptide (TPR) repeat protein
MSRRRAVPLTPGAPSGWAWRRLSTVAGILTLGVSALVAVAAVWMRMADTRPRVMVQLVVASVILAVIGFASAAVGRVAELRERRVGQVAQWQATVRHLVRELPGGALPRLSMLADAALGSIPTRYTLQDRAPYVRRPAVDADLVEVLNTAGPPYGFVVLVGPSTAGKSRTAVQAARAAWSDWDPVVVVPADGEALAALMRLDPPLPLEPAPAVVWLDDLTAGDLAYLSADVLHSVLQHAFLVATMNDERWDKVRHDDSAVTVTARAALRRATRMSLAFDLTRTETDEAGRLYPHEHVAASIAETLIGGDRLVDKLQAGRKTDPAGYAIVQAAVDARRAGLSRPIAETELHRLYPLHLRRIRVDLDPTPALFQQGLSWARLPVESQVALLRRATGRNGWDVLDYAVEVEDGQGGRPGRPILDEIWHELIAAVPADDAYDVGLEAHLREESDVATAAFRKAKESGHSGLAGMAALALGMMAHELDDVTAAGASYQQLSGSAPPEQAELATFAMGRLLQEQEDVAGARAAYQQLVDSDDPDLKAMALLALGTLLADQDDAAGAEAAYQQVIESDHPDHKPMAAVRLGILLAEHGETAKAQAAYQLAIDSGHPEAAPLAEQLKALEG